jgi:hypothetical protein
LRKDNRIPKSEQIKLNAKVEKNLKEVIVSNKRKKKKEKLLELKQTEGILMYFTSNSLGTEIGKIITVKNKIYDLKNVQFNLPKLINLPLSGINFTLL